MSWLLYLGNPPGAISGSLAVTESGSDSASASGSVIVAGSLGVSESGIDAFAASGSIVSSTITGDMAATESGLDTFSGISIRTDLNILLSLAVTEIDISYTIQNVNLSTSAVNISLSK